MTINANERKAIAAGQTLTATYKKAQYTVKVVAGEEGRLLYVLGDGREFKSPSAAGSAVMGGSACNGWRFWSLDDSTHPAAAKTPAKPSAEPAAKQAAAQQPAKAERPLCEDCGKSFVAAKQLEHHRANADRLCRPAA